MADEYQFWPILKDSRGNSEFGFVPHGTPLAGLQNTESQLQL